MLQFQLAPADKPKKMYLHKGNECKKQAIICWYVAKQHINRVQNKSLRKNKKSLQKIIKNSWAYRKQVELKHQHFLQKKKGSQVRAQRFMPAKVMSTDIEADKQLSIAIILAFKLLHIFHKAYFRALQLAWLLIFISLLLPTPSLHFSAIAVDAFTSSLLSSFYSFLCCCSVRDNEKLEKTHRSCRTGFTGNICVGRLNGSALWSKEK